MSKDSNLARAATFHRQRDFHGDTCVEVEKRCTRIACLAAVTSRETERDCAFAIFATFHKGNKTFSEIIILK